MGKAGGPQGLFTVLGPSRIISFLEVFENMRGVIKLF